MPRAHRHLTWRIERARDDTSNDVCLQTLHPVVFELSNGGEHVSNTLQWITVARGREEDLKQVAQALNRARFTLFDIRPVARRKRR